MFCSPFLLCYITGIHSYYSLTMNNTVLRVEDEFASDVILVNVSVEDMKVKVSSQVWSHENII